MSVIDFFCAELEKWQKSIGLELIKVSPPICGEDGKGERVRLFDTSNLWGILHESVRGAKADPLYYINPEAAIRKHSEIVAREVKGERNAGKFNRKGKRRRKRR